MISKAEQYKEAYVWIWPPGDINPVVAGRLEEDDGLLYFNYGKSYLNRDAAMAIYDKELPLKQGVFPMIPGLKMPNCIRDASPDAWGRRVIINKIQGKYDGDTNQLNELTYLLESGSDRIGALDFQVSPTNYTPRKKGTASLEELLTVAELVEEGKPVSDELSQVLNHGTSIGGARPKALIEEKNRKYIAKFSSSADIYNVVKLEYVAMRLAALCGLDVANVSLTKSLEKDVLLIERFDRERIEKGWLRRGIVSALTLLGLDEMVARYASYGDLAEIIRHRFKEAPKMLKELFSRLVFNILVGNTDDHARNHAAFWDGESLSLTPAYDICPQNRTGNISNQAMSILGTRRESQLLLCQESAHNFLLNNSDARDIIENQVKVIESNWVTICDEAEISSVDRNLFWKRQFLNPYVFEGYKG